MHSPLASIWQPTRLFQDKVAPHARVAELVDALDLGSSGATRESSSLSSRTTSLYDFIQPLTPVRPAS